MVASLSTRTLLTNFSDSIKVQNVEPVNRDKMKIALVVPAHNGFDELACCMAAISESSRQADELILVDDGSKPNTLQGLSKKYNFKYIAVTDGPRGPGHARNIGVKQCSADIVLFIDSDVVVAVDTVENVEQEFSQPHHIDALFGSYDTTPSVKTVVSQYKNLLHYFVHQNGHSEAKTFWAGCGAVRRDVFESVGGFNEAFQKPSIEDIDFGLRMSDAGFKIKLCPEIQVKHLKHWTLASVIKTDIFSRAIPWTTLIANNRRKIGDDLNTKLQHRVSALVTLLLILSGVMILLGYSMHLVFMALLSIYIFIDRRLFSFFYRIGGLKLAIGGACMHLLYYAYSSITFVAVSLTIGFKRLISSLTQHSQTPEGR